MSTLEASFGLAKKYIEATDPKKAREMAEATAKISKETDPAKAKDMLASLEQHAAHRRLFADMQVKSALTAYMQNKALYAQLKKDASATPRAFSTRTWPSAAILVAKWDEALKRATMRCAAWVTRFGPPPMRWPAVSGRQRVA